MCVTQSNYSKVLDLSLLFYEAQRSGELPSDNRIPWRSDSMLMDKGVYDEDLSGGYFSGGDHVKFVGQIAITTTILSWGVIDYQFAYEQSQLLTRVHEAIKWATDFLIEVCFHPYLMRMFLFIGHI